MPATPAPRLRGRRSFRIAFGVAVPALAAGALALVYGIDPGRPGLPTLCPTRLLTGLYCPGCGSTRMIHSLLHLRFFEAFDFNPLMFLLLPFLLYALLSGYLRVVAGRTVLPLPRTPTWAAVVLLVVVVVFTVLRNLPYAPFSFLAP